MSNPFALATISTMASMVSTVALCLAIAAHSAIMVGVDLLIIVPNAAMAAYWWSKVK